MASNSWLPPDPFTLLIRLSTGKTHVVGGIQMAMPGDGVQLSVELLQPIALTTGDHFAIREGGKTVGSGVVAKVNA